MSLPDLDGFIAVLRGATWEGVEGAQAPGNGLGILAPVDLAFGLFDLVRVVHAFGRLGRARQAAAGAHLQRLDDEAPAQVGQLVVQAGRGVVGGDGQALDQAHVARVQARIHLHDGDAGLGITGLDGAVDGGGAAPARQQAGVDVQAAARRRIEHPLRQDQPVGGHDHDIGLGRFDGGAGGGGLFGVFAVQAQAARLGHGNAMLQRALLDGRGLQLHAAPGRTVGLGQHQGDGEARGEQAFKGNARELGRAGKNDSHAIQ